MSITLSRALLTLSCLAAPAAAQHVHKVPQEHDTIQGAVFGDSSASDVGLGFVSGVYRHRPSSGGRRALRRRPSPRRSS